MSRIPGQRQEKMRRDVPAQTMRLENRGQRILLPSPSVAFGLSADCMVAAQGRAFCLLSRGRTCLYHPETPSQTRTPRNSV